MKLKTYIILLGQGYTLSPTEKDTHNYQFVGSVSAVNIPHALALINLDFKDLFIDLKEKGFTKFKIMDTETEHISDGYPIDQDFQYLVKIYTNPAEKDPQIEFVVVTDKEILENELKTTDDIRNYICESSSHNFDQNVAVFLYDEFIKMLLQINTAYEKN